MYPKLQEYIRSLNETGLTKKRLPALQKMASAIASKIEKENPVNLVFICTHNSRRSQMAQALAQAIASYYNFHQVQCFSGGTEETSLYPACLNALTNAGFASAELSSGVNPIYAIKYGENDAPIIGYSKKYDSFSNPSNGFIALMTCDDANEACPIVKGASERIPWSFEDPKRYDGTEQESAKYEDKCREIAGELKYVFQNLKAQI